MFSALGGHRIYFFKSARIDFLKFSDVSISRRGSSLCHMLGRAGGVFWPITVYFLSVTSCDRVHSGGLRIRPRFCGEMLADVILGPDSGIRQTLE